MRAVNKVQPSLIRTQADELTYSLHILIRYEIEKQLMEGTLKVKDLPEVWADKYEEYLGVRPANAAEGVLLFPYATPTYQPIRPLKHEYRKILVQNYLMFYWVDEEKKLVTVARVVYAKRDYGRLLE